MKRQLILPRPASRRPAPPWDMDDKLREECGVFGIFGNEEAAALTVLGLHALQHRGQEAAGMVTFDGRLFTTTAPSGWSAIISAAKR